MYLYKSISCLLTLSATGVFAEVLGPTYPSPIDLSSNTSIVSTTWKNLSAIFDSYFKENKTSNITALLSEGEVNKITFSLGLFSLEDAAATKLQYHYTSPEIANSTQGTKKVDADSIYRVASVSKLITVFAGLLNLNDEEWNRPLTQIFPLLADYVSKTINTVDPVYRIPWEQITPWTLANQIAGIPQLGIAEADGALALVLANSTAPKSLPPINITALGPCGDLTLDQCTPDDFLEGFEVQAPSFLPWTTPAYADSGFMVLGLAISNMTGKPIADIYQDSVFKPLGMTSSNGSVPSDPSQLARSVIAGDPAANFALQGGVSNPSGGLFSTLNDLDKLGVGILNSTLYPANLTRKWMKPTSNTASLTYNLGAPWEIIRYIHASGKVTDIYTKLGDSGNYGASLALIPDYNAGISFLNGNSNATLRSPAALTVLDYVLEAVLPALEAQAAAEATRNFVGTYVSTDPKLNSSVVIAFNKTSALSTTYPLSITSWISNGTDALKELFAGGKPRLQVSIPKTSLGPGKVAFQTSLQPQYDTYVEASKAGVGPWSGLYFSNGGWVHVSAAPYDGIDEDLWVFDVNDTGNATAVSPAVTKVTLQRKST